MDGRQFVSFRVAHTNVRTKADGSRQESTQWVSCSLNGDGGKLLPYLVKGAKVYISGDGETRMYNSAKSHGLQAGLNCFVRDIELVSTNVDAVPRELYDKDGAVHPVTKFFACPDIIRGELYDRRGQTYTVEEGWIKPQQAATEENQPEVY